MNVLPEYVVAETQRLLRSRLSQREISRRLPISRGSVQNIQHGRRQLCFDNMMSSGGIYQCTTCGNRVYRRPCPVCEARRARAKKPRRITPPAAERETGLVLELRGAEAERFQFVKRG